VLVTPKGAKVLGPGIPKTIEEVEAACRGCRIMPPIPKELSERFIKSRRTP
jgi:hypothetical protein